jgi:hypothetical protein
VRARIKIDDMQFGFRARKGTTDAILIKAGAREVLIQEAGTMDGVCGS